MTSYSSFNGPARVAVAAVAAALALFGSLPARADAVVTQKRAEAAVAQLTAPAARTAAIHDQLTSDAAGVELHVVETVIVSEPDDPPAWFPTLTEDDLTLGPSPVQRTAFAMPGDGINGINGRFITSEHAVIPLPPAAWTGLAGLGTLAAIGWRRAIVRFFT